MQRPAAATRSRPRDAQATRELLLAAAPEEFSEFGLARPQPARLGAWRAFERAEPTEAEVHSFAIKVAAIEGAQKSGKLNADITAIDLFAMVLRLTESWTSAPPALRSLAGQDPDAKQRIHRHRAALIDAVSSFTTPAKSGTGPSRAQKN